MVMNRLFYLLALICVTLESVGQERGYMLSKYYPPDLHKGGSQCWSVVEDNRGVMYFGNIAGVLEFDSKTWKMYPVKNGSTVRSLAKDNAGTVYVGAYAEIGKMSVDASGKMYYEPLMDLIDKQYADFKDVWCINSLSDTVLFMTESCIFRLVGNKFSYFPSATNAYYLSFEVNGEYYVQEMGRGLLRLQGDSLALVSSLPIFLSQNVHSIFPYTDGFLVGTRANGFYIVDTTCNRAVPISTISDRAEKLNSYFKKNNYYCGINLPNGNRALSSVMGDILIVDSCWTVVDIIDNKTKQNDNEALYLYLQKNNMLWVALGDGICQVEVMSEFRYWDKNLGIYGNLSDVARNEGKFYVSTKQGLFCMSDNADYFGFSHFEKIDGKFESANLFLRFWVPNSKKRILLMASSTGIYEINGCKANMVLSCRNANKLCQSRVDSLTVFATTTSGVVIIRYENGRWVEKNDRLGIADNVVDFREDPNGDLWITTQIKGAYRVRNYGVGGSLLVENFDSTSGFPQTANMSFGDSAYFFSSNGDVYLFNDSLSSFSILERKQYAEEEKNSFANSDSGLSYLSLLRYGYTTSSFLCYPADYETSNYWFSSEDGVVRFTNNGYVKGTGKLPKTLIRCVQTPDSVLFYGTNPKKERDGFVVDTAAVVDLSTSLRYDINSLIFIFVCPFYERECKLEYSYMLKGFDREWSDWSSSTKKEYTNLNSGSYKFMVRARYLGNYIADTAVFEFSILPPWYTSIWACLLYTVVAGLLVVLVVRINTIRLIREKDKLEGLVKLRTQEIQIQNEEIMVQAEHLRDVNDCVTQKNAELSEQKQVLEQKTKELEFSIATKNRFFRIIAHDLRNPISTFVSSTNFMLSEYESFDRLKTMQILEELNRMSHNTYNLLENLLDWSASQMGSLRCVPKLLNISSLVAENMDLLEAKFQLKNIEAEVDADEGITVVADENMFNTVVRNLLTNATKYTHDNGRIKVVARADSKFCHLSIADNGIGMNPDTLSKLFRMDTSCSMNGTHNEKGTGLGLILSKEFMERMGGSIKVQSTLGVGSTFTILIPLGSN